MFNYKVCDINDLELYLSDNGYQLNRNISNEYHDSIYQYCKHPYIVQFNTNNDIVIKDLINSRKFKFDSTSSINLVINFIKYLEKDFILL